MEEKQTGRARRFVTVLLCAAVAAAVLWLWESGLLERINSKEKIRAMSEAAGPFAGVVYFLIQLLTVIIAPIPSNISMMAGALAMGFWPALILGLAAIWLGSMGMFLLARRLGQRRVQKLVDHGVMEKYLPVIREKQEVFLFLALLFPFFPDDVLCILAGVTSIPTGRFAVLVLLARPWGLVFAALLGSGVFSLPVWGWAIMLTALVVLFIFAVKYSGRIEDRLLAWIYTIRKGKKT